MKRIQSTSVAVTTAVMLVVSLVAVSPAHAEEPAAETVQNGPGVELSDELVGEEPVEPTVTDVELSEVSADEDYTETPKVDRAEGDAQQNDLIESATSGSGTNAGAVRIELNSDVNVFGVTWVEDAPALIKYRHLTGEEWSEWIEVEVAEVESDVVEASAGGGTDPVFIVDAAAVEVVAFTADGQHTSDFTVKVVDPRGESPAESSFDTETTLVESPAETPLENEPPDPANGEVEPDVPESAEGPAADPVSLASPPTFQFANESTDAMHPMMATTSLAQTTSLDTGFGLKINTRKAWGANEEWRKFRVRNGKVVKEHAWVSPSTTYRGVVVHHTAGSNNYTKAQVPAVMRGIYYWHTQGVNFADVGYQLLVDKYGGVWEGRYDSLKRSLVGAQALGANYETFGISVIGDYTNSPPPAAAQESTARAIAYMFKRYNISNPKGTIRIPHQSGKGATVPTILPHFMATATSCPGAAFTKRLPALRDRVVYHLNLSRGELVPPFIDVWTNDRFPGSISWLSSQGITTGIQTSRGIEFWPLSSVTREAMAAFLYRLNGSPKVTLPAASPFADMRSGDKFYREIVWMHQSGLANGTRQPSGKPLYKPKDGMSREAMAAFMYRLDASSNGFRAPGSSPFADVSPSQNFYREIAWMHSSGLSTGTRQPSGKPLYKAKDDVTREAVAAFLYRFAN